MKLSHVFRMNDLFSEITLRSHLSWLTEAKLKPRDQGRADAVECAAAIAETLRWDNACRTGNTRVRRQSWEAKRDSADCNGRSVLSRPVFGKTFADRPVWFDRYEGHEGGPNLRSDRLRPCIICRRESRRRFRGNTWHSSSDELMTCSAGTHRTRADRVAARPASVGRAGIADHQFRPVDDPMTYMLYDGLRRWPGWRPAGGEPLAGTGSTTIKVRTMHYLDANADPAPAHGSEGRDDRCASGHRQPSPRCTGREGARGGCSRMPGKRWRNSLAASPKGLVFTSGGTEADALAIHAMSPGPASSSSVRSSTMRPVRRGGARADHSAGRSQRRRRPRGAGVSARRRRAGAGVPHAGEQRNRT